MRRAAPAPAGAAAARSARAGVGQIRGLAHQGSVLLRHALQLAGENAAEVDGQVVAQDIDVRIGCLRLAGHLLHGEAAVILDAGLSRKRRLSNRRRAAGEALSASALAYASGGVPAEGSSGSRKSRP